VKTLSLLSFEGFYESIHSQNIDWEVEKLFQDDHGDPHIPEDFYSHYNQSDIETEYCKAYVSNIQWLLKEAGVDLPSMRFESLSSPKEYNFTTDRIFIELNDEDICTMVYVYDHDILSDTVKKHFTSRSGFISFYDSDIREWSNNVLGDWDCNQLGTLLEAVLLTVEVEPREIMDDCSEEMSNLVYENLPDKCREMVNKFTEERAA